MLELLKHIDRDIFFFINGKMSNPFFDAILPWCREKYSWIPLYAILVAWIIYVFRKQSWKVIISVVPLIVATDQLASGVFKPLFRRYRPCNNLEYGDMVNELAGCGSGFSFVSSHAANHFGLAVFLTIVMGRQYKWLPPLLIFWAALVSFSQVYVGLHYPLDITGGAIIGITFGWIAGRLVNKWIGLSSPRLMND